MKLEVLSTFGKVAAAGQEHFPPPTFSKIGSAHPFSQSAVNVYQPRNLREGELIHPFPLLTVYSQASTSEFQVSGELHPGVFSNMQVSIGSFTPPRSLAYKKMSVYDRKRRIPQTDKEV